MTAVDRPVTTPRPVSEIPGPKPLPVIGNFRDVDTKTLVQGLMKQADRYGEIFVLHTPAPLYIVSGLDMVQDLCDDARFDKLVGTGQREIRKTQ